MKNRIDWVWTFVDESINDVTIRVFYKHTMKDYLWSNAPRTVVAYIMQAERTTAKTAHGTTIFYKVKA